MAKWIIGIVVVILIGVGLWYSGVLGTFMTPPAPVQQTATTTPQTQQAAAQPEDGMSANNDASDAAITQDTAAIDAQMQGLTTDSANVDTSLNDKSVQ
ncbi:MAG TPA: hypothetical protein VMR46_02710 [Candidatus Paceibacterota bacterium]|jgi:cytoskeletal protein RodZ|nr:hypothetical protein [Candidatus Paceibacterota bacterium]